VTMGAGLRPTAKGVDEPPDPTVRAPALDPTGGGRMEKDAAGYPQGHMKPGTSRISPAAYPTPIRFDERGVETGRGEAIEAPADERAGNR
jgi:hypothetical protein